MDIRLATKDDVIAISAMLTKLASDFIVKDFSNEGTANILHSMSPEAIFWCLDKGYCYHVGLVSNQLVGVVATRDNSHLYHLFVREIEQGNGYSRQLWETAKQSCITAGNEGEFTLNSSLNALAVYEGWGFVPIADMRVSKGVKDIPMKLASNPESNHLFRNTTA